MAAAAAAAGGREEDREGAHNAAWDGAHLPLELQLRAQHPAPQLVQPSPLRLLGGAQGGGTACEPAAPALLPHTGRRGAGGVEGELRAPVPLHASAQQHTRLAVRVPATARRTAASSGPTQHTGPSR
jgi:hypothetical protein